jgi:heme A synthase
MALRGYVWYLNQMIKRADPWDTRSAISRWAHVIERIGLALAGGSCGLFVAADVARADVDLLGSPVAILTMMLYGAAGFYLGIDLPPAPPDHRMQLPRKRKLGSRADAVELLSAAGTFLAAVAAVVSVSGIVLDETVRPTTARMIILCWAIGATMQIAAGIMARMRPEASPPS